MRERSKKPVTFPTLPDALKIKQSNDVRFPVAVMPERRLHSDEPSVEPIERDEGYNYFLV